jgi:hypothetical protein
VLVVALLAFAAWWNVHPVAAAAGLIAQAAGALLAARRIVPLLAAGGTTAAGATSMRPVAVQTRAVKPFPVSSCVGHADYLLAAHSGPMQRLGNRLSIH